MVAKKSKLYSTTDIESIRGQLAELPDVTQERLQKRVEHLKNFGFHDVTLKDLKEITEGKRTRQRKRVSSSTDDKTPVQA